MTLIPEKGPQSIHLLLPTDTIWVNDSLTQRDQDTE